MILGTFPPENIRSFGDDDSSSGDDDLRSGDDDSSSSDDDSSSGGPKKAFNSRTQAQTELYGIDFDKVIVKLNELSSTLLHNSST
ncbi:hypothetical protein YC2023_060214 [Brassica napus]